jgi:hypothetical protein
MGSSVGAIVGVLVGAAVKVGNAVAVNVTVGTNVGISGEASTTGAGIACTWGVQALLSKIKRRRMAVTGFMNIPPGDEVVCCLNGNDYLVVPKIIQPPAPADG